MLESCNESGDGCFERRRHELSPQQVRGCLYGVLSHDGLRLHHRLDYDKRWADFVKEGGAPGTGGPPAAQKKKERTPTAREKEAARRADHDLLRRSNIEGDPGGTRETSGDGGGFNEDLGQNFLEDAEESEEVEDAVEHYWARMHQSTWSSASSPGSAPTKGRAFYLHHGPNTIVPKTLGLLHFVVITNYKVG